MFTVKYKGCFIHGYFDRPEVKVDGRRFKSMYAAKRFITRNGVVDGLKAFVVKLQHDKGLCSLRVKARDILAACQIVQTAENCPLSAIVSIVGA